MRFARRAYERSFPSRSSFLRVCRMSVLSQRCLAIVVSFSTTPEAPPRCCEFCRTPGLHRLLPDPQRWLANPSRSDSLSQQAGRNLTRAMKGRPKKSHREKDLTSRYFAGRLDEDQVESQERFGDKSKHFQQRKT